MIKIICFKCKHLQSKLSHWIGCSKYEVKNMEEFLLKELIEKELKEENINKE